MNDEIKVGDVCEIVGLTPEMNGYHLNGMQCTVIEYISGRLAPEDGHLREFHVRWTGSIYFGKDRGWISRQHLRKLRPPREDLQAVRWQECPWQPQAVKA